MAEAGCTFDAYDFLHFGATHKQNMSDALQGSITNNCTVPSMGNLAEIVNDKNSVP